jgi:PAS domain S-box-containing protein
MAKEKKKQQWLRESEELKTRLQKAEDALDTARKDNINELKESRLAALNLMEDAQVSRQQAESLNIELQKEIQEHKLTEEALVWNSRRNELLSETASELLQSEAPKDIIDQLCRQVMDFLDCHVFFNYLVEQQEGRLHLHACTGINKKSQRGLEWLDFGQTICGSVALERHRIVAEDIKNSSDERTVLLRAFGIQAFCCHPLIIQNRLIGILAFGTRSRPQFEPDEVEVMKSFTDLVAMALYRIKIEEQIKNVAKFPIENPYPVLRIKKDGTILYSNTAGQVVLKEWNCEIGQKVSSEWLGKVKNSMRYGRLVTENIKCGQSIYSIAITPVVDGGYVNLYGRDITIQEQIKEELRRTNEELDNKVRERTRDLAQTIAILQKEIKDRITAQTTLRERTKVLDAFFAHSITPLVILDNKFNFIRANQAYAEACQKEIDEFEGRNHFELYPDEENEKIFKEVVKTKKPFQTFAKPFTYPDHPEWGMTYWNWSLVPILDRDEKVEFLVFSLVDVTKRKQAELALQESEEKYRSLVEFSPESVCALVDEKVVFINVAGMKLLKAKSLEDVIGKSMWDFIHPDSVDLAQSDMKMILETNRKVIPRDIKLNLLDGSVGEVETSATSVIHQGKPGILVMFHDISERKIAEGRKNVVDSLLDLFAHQTSRQEYLDAVVNIIRNWSGCECVGIRLKDVDGYIPYESHTGFSDDFLTLENMLSLKSDICLCCRAVMRTPEPQDVPLLTERGSIRTNNAVEFIKKLPKNVRNRYRGNCMKFGFASLAVIPIHYRENVGAIHLADMEANKVSLENVEFLEDMASLIGEAIHRFNVENNLRKNEKRLLEAQKLAHLGNWEWDIKRNRLWWSDEVYRIFGLEPKLFGITFDDFLSYIHPEDRKLVQESLNQAFLESREYSIDYRVVRPNGSERIINEKAEVTCDASGRKPIKMAGTVYDITEQKRAEEEIRENQRELRALSAELQLVEEQERRKIAQDLHDSIGQILAFSGRELKHLQKSVSERAAKTLEEISDQLDLAVTQTRSLSFDLSPSILYDLGFEVAIEDLVDRISQERNMQCTFKNCSLPKPLADEVKVLLYRSVRELLLNAAKYSEAEHVNVSLLRSSSDIYIKVEDDGKGFDVSILENSSTRRKGFGIFSIRERLNHIGGRLKIESADREGTRAVLIAPLDIEDENQ